MWFEAPPLPQLKRLWSDYFSKHALLVRHNLGETWDCWISRLASKLPNLKVISFKIIKIIGPTLHLDSNRNS